MEPASQDYFLSFPKSIFELLWFGDDPKFSGGVSFEADRTDGGRIIECYIAAKPRLKCRSSDEELNAPGQSMSSFLVIVFISSNMGLIIYGCKDKVKQKGKSTL